MYSLRAADNNRANIDKMSLIYYPYGVFYRHALLKDGRTVDYERDLDMDIPCDCWVEAITDITDGDNPNPSQFGI